MSVLDAVEAHTFAPRRLSHVLTDVGETVSLKHRPPSPHEYSWCSFLLVSESPTRPSCRCKYYVIDKDNDLLESSP
jgi:hypothetical protein